MTHPVSHLIEVCEKTWPPARVWEQDGWILRDGDGGGKRVSAATLGQVGARVVDAERAMEAQGQHPLFMVQPGQDDLDAQLADAGYDVVDPVNIYACPLALLTDIPIPRVTVFSIWEPLAIMEEIWETGGIGSARLRVMARAKTKTGILSRWNEKPAGVAFAAIHNGTCMVHAVEVLKHQRRQGVANWMMRKAAFWAEGLGARQMSVLCTQDNQGANALYSSLGMQVMGQYQYRQKGL